MVAVIGRERQRGVEAAPKLCWQHARRAAAFTPLFAANTVCSGGLELLFGNKKNHKVEVPLDSKTVSCEQYNQQHLRVQLRLPGEHPRLAGACMQTHLPSPALLYPPPQLTVRQLLPWTRDNLLQDRPELFMKGDSV
jgi:hypothetical protein